MRGVFFFGGFGTIVVSRAFQVLSDPDKRRKYDSFGGDPDRRFGPGSASASSSTPRSSPFGRSSGFGGGGAESPRYQAPPMWEEEISPEEMFNRFFGGGGPFGGMS